MLSHHARGIIILSPNDIHPFIAAHYTVPINLFPSFICILISYPIPYLIYNCYMSCILFAVRNSFIVLMINALMDERCVIRLHMYVYNTHTNISARSEINRSTSSSPFTTEARVFPTHYIHQLSSTHISIPPPPIG